MAHTYSRGPHGDFNLRPEEVRGLSGVIHLPALGITLTMLEVYDGLEFGTVSDVPSIAPGSI